ncbi:MAG: hypothetical protein ACLFWL_08915 [Candidatus Brocadiia bacterium]
MSKKESAISKAKKAAAKKLEGLDQIAEKGKEKYPPLFSKKQKTG